MAIPSLTTEQLRQAREKATRARRRRAEVKDQLRAGDLSFTEVLELATDDDVVAHIKVFDVLKCLPRVGDKRAAQMMDRLEIAPNRRLRGLGHHQATSLQGEFNQHQHESE